MKKRAAQVARYVLPTVLTVWLGPLAAPQGGYTESGVASWYGYPYHGRTAASGELFDMEEMTAAHPTLPFNTLVRVVNLGNAKSVQVRITDRGPFVDGRIIDLSRAAARGLGLIETGIAQVRLEVVGAAPVVRSAAAAAPAVFGERAAASVDAGGIFAVQTGAFRNQSNAERHFGVMKARYGRARLTTADDGSGLWRVLVGAENTREAADALAARIRQDSGENNAFVVRLDSLNEPDSPGQFPRPRGAVAADGLHPPAY